MIRLVIDTNVIVSASLQPEGPPALIVRLVRHGQVALVVSTPILAEYEEVLRRPRFKLDSDHISAFIQMLHNAAEIVEPSHMLIISRDETDNRFLECAEESKADYLITGNRKHFPKKHKTTRIVSPSEFLEIWGATLTGKTVT